MWIMEAIAATQSVGGANPTPLATAMGLEFSLGHPVVIAAVASLMTVVATKLFDMWIAHKKARDTFRHSDRELLSADEKDFRLTIIRQLQACHDANIAKDKELFRFQTENIELTSRVASLEFELSRIKATVNKVADETVVAVEKAAKEVTETIGTPERRLPDKR